MGNEQSLPVKPGEAAGNHTLGEIEHPKDLVPIGDSSQMQHNRECHLQVDKTLSRCLRSGHSTRLTSTAESEPINGEEVAPTSMTPELMVGTAIHKLEVLNREPSDQLT